MERPFTIAADWRHTMRQGLVPALVLAPLLVGAAWICADALHLEIGMPLQLNYVEGFNIDDAARIVRSEPLYGDPSHAPFVLSVYTPGYPAMVAMLMKLGLPGLVAGRLLTFLSTLGISCVVALAGCRRNGWIALAAAAFFLIDPLMSFWQVVARPDCTAALLAITGIVLLETSTTSRRDVAAAALFAASILTKQSFVAAPIAALLFLFRQDRKRAARFSVVLSFFCVLPALALQVASHGRFLWATVVGNLNPYSWSRVRGLGGEFWSRHPFLILLLLALFLAGWRSHPRSATALWAAIASVIGTIMLGKTGSDLNYLVETSAAITLLAAREFPRNWFARPVPAATVSAILLGACTVAVAVSAVVQTTRIRRPLDAAQAPYRELMARVSREHGIVVSDDACLLVAARKPVHIQPFVMSQLARSGHWDQRPFLAELENQEVRLIVVQVRPQTVFASRYTPEMRRLMAERYVVDERYNLAGEFVVLVPNVPR